MKRSPGQSVFWARRFAQPHPGAPDGGGEAFSPEQPQQTSAMNPKHRQHPSECDNWICPHLGPHWKLAKIRGADQVVLLGGTTKIKFSPAEGFALQHFTGKLTIAQIQQRCQKQFAQSLSANFVGELVQKLIQLEILAIGEDSDTYREPAILPASPDWICPDLTPYWQIAPIPESQQVILKAIDGNLRVLFSAAEGYALEYFTGIFTVAQIQELCQQHFGEIIPPNFIRELLQKLIKLNILELTEPPTTEANHQANVPQLKAEVHWIDHPDGYWILRNPEDVTFLQLSDRDKNIIDQIGRRSTRAIVEEFCISQQYLNHLLQLLASTAMLQGTTPPPPPKGKFNPMKLLYFRLPLCNPDPWLSRNIDSIRWIWTKPFALILFTILAFSTIIGIHQQTEIIQSGKQLMAAHGAGLMIPFALLSMFVVTIHELGHAFTLKNFGGIVPQIGLLLMMFMPAAYTNTTDSYCLSRFKRVLVVGAGLLVQFTMWAIGLGLWNWTNPSSGLHTISYLLMVASLVTVAINLNPLAKFDGYYLAVAMTGINNLRSRSFAFYGNLLRGKPTRETPGDALILAIYAPFSLVYIYLVFGFLLARIADWSLTHIPITALLLLTIWAIYFFAPSDNR